MSKIWLLQGQPCSQIVTLFLNQPGSEADTGHDNACSLSWLDQESSLPSHTLYMQQFANVQVLMSAMNDSMREETEELWANITEVR